MKKAFQFAAILTLSGLITMSESQAGHKSHGSAGSYGSYGSVGSTGSVGGSYGSIGSAASDGGSYGSHGSSGRRARKSKGSSGGASSGGDMILDGGSSGGASSGGSSGRIKVKKVRVTRSKGSSGSLGSTGSGGGSYGSHASAGSSSYGGSHGTAVYSQPVYHAAPTGCADGNCAVSTTSPVAKPAYAGYALLVVNVPADASVYLDNKLMQTTGESRKFKIPVRTAGQSYSYPVRVELNQNGKTQVATFAKAIAAGKMTVVNATAGSSNEAIHVAAR